MGHALRRRCSASPPACCSRAGAFPGRDIVDALLLLPMVLPPTVLGYYLLVAFGRNSALGHWLERTLGIELIFTWQGAVLAAAVVAFPLVFKAARAAFEGVDRDVENAGRTLGYGEWTVFARITLPLAWRGIVAGSMLAFARAMGEFGATLMVAGNIPGPHADDVDRDLRGGARRRRRARQHAGADHLGGVHHAPRARELLACAADAPHRAALTR